MHPAIILEATAAAVTVLSVVAGFVYTSGRREGKVTSALEENGRAISKLSLVLDKLADKLDDHETRITVVETKLKGK